MTLIMIIIMWAVAIGGFVWFISAEPEQLLLALLIGIPVIIIESIVTHTWFLSNMERRLSDRRYYR